jgi:hypothetical protein
MYACVRVYVPTYMCVHVIKGASHEMSRAHLPGNIEFYINHPVRRFHGRTHAFASRVIMCIILAFLLVPKSDRREGERERERERESHAIMEDRCFPCLCEKLSSSLMATAPAMLVLEELSVRGPSEDRPRRIPRWRRHHYAERRFCLWTVRAIRVTGKYAACAV